MADLVAALKESDFSIRARRPASNDPLGSVLSEINQLGTMLREERLGAVEAGALLRTLMVEVDVAVFTFDAASRLRLVNRAGERLLAGTADTLLGRPARALGLSAWLEGPTPRVADVMLPGGGGRFEIRRTGFRQRGLSHQLLVLADVSRALRDEERHAWHRLIRVIGHEINNSLTPIKSIAGTIGTVLARDPLPADWRDDVQRGLAIVAARAESLSRFTTSYAALARLPPPRLEAVDVGAIVRRAIALERRLAVEVVPSPDAVVRADPDQLEQLLINLLRNAADAALPAGGGVRVSWTTEAAFLDLRIDDDGSGPPGAHNLFVPFFTTKPGGSGIGLVLSRQIAEAHGGTLTLENRPDAPGATARLRIPIATTGRD